MISDPSSGGIRLTAALRSHGLAHPDCRPGRRTIYRCGRSGGMMKKASPPLFLPTHVLWDSNARNQYVSRNRPYRGSRAPRSVAVRRRSHRRPVVGSTHNACGPATPPRRRCETALPPYRPNGPAQLVHVADQGIQPTLQQIDRKKISPSRHMVTTIVRHNVPIRRADVRRVIRPSWRPSTRQLTFPYPHPNIVQTIKSVTPIPSGGTRKRFRLTRVDPILSSGFPSVLEDRKLQLRPSLSIKRECHAETQHE